MKPTKALVVLSGGQDSTTCLYWAKTHFEEVHTVSFDYDQRHSIELIAAERVAKLAKVESHTCIKLHGGILKSTSPLTSDAPLEKYADHASMEKIIGDRVELTFVPMRNFIFLGVAINHALSLGIRDLVTGICQADGANYPDTTHDFRTKFAGAANEALGLTQLGTLVDIHAPLMYMSKAESVKLAYEMEGCRAALAFSHTSYDGKYPPVDNNHANVLRAHGFEVAGLPDPLVLRANLEGFMNLPATPNYQDDALNRSIGDALVDAAEEIFE
jgi:7-cyano-7-deazaguanine synthase